MNLHCHHWTHSIITARFHPSNPWPYFSDSSDNLTDVPFKSTSTRIHLSILLSHYICAHPDTVVIGLGSGGVVLLVHHLVVGVVWVLWYSLALIFHSLANNPRQSPHWWGIRKVAYVSSLTWVYIYYIFLLLYPPRIHLCSTCPALK